jgi:hypothetical protein
MTHHGNGPHFCPRRSLEYVYTLSDSLMDPNFWRWLVVERARPASVRKYPFVETQIFPKLSRIRVGTPRVFKY